LTGQGLKGASLVQRWRQLAHYFFVHRRGITYSALVSVPLVLLPASEGYGTREEPPVRGSTPAQLQQARDQAFIGSFPKLEKFWTAEISTYWPHWLSRTLFLPGDAPRGLSWPDFSRVYLNAVSGVGPVDLEVARLRFELAQARNQDQAGVTINLQPRDAVPLVLVALPMASCPSCELPVQPATPETCRPIHPDSAFMQGLERLRLMYHEQAHWLRMQRGDYVGDTQQERHREEVIAEIYGDARLLQSYGPQAYGLVARSMQREPVSSENSHLYLAYAGRQKLLNWYNTNPAAFARLHPDQVMDQVATLVEPTLLSEEQLEQLAAFAQQTPFVALGAKRRLALLARQGMPRSGTSPRRVVDEKGCRWDYPGLLRQLDRELVGRAPLPGARLLDIVQQNFLRPSALQGAGPFSLNRDDPAQVQALIAFNNLLRPAMCPALTDADVHKADLWLPIPIRVSKAVTSPAAKPQQRQTKPPPQAMCMR